MHQRSNSNWQEVWEYQKYESNKEMLRNSLSCWDKYSLQAGADGIMKALRE